MHASSMLRMQWFKEKYLETLIPADQVQVLDVGSQSVKEQTDSYKVFFKEPPYKYIGLDMAEGNNVDIAVKKAYQWDEVPNDFCDVLISGQTFEHIEFPWITICEMTRVLKPNGLMCIIVPSAQGLHRYPVNCQNYFSDGLIALARYAGLDILHVSTNYAPKGAGPEWYNMKIQDSILIAKKPLSWKQHSFDKEHYKLSVCNLEKMATGLIPIEMQSWYPKWHKSHKIKLFVAETFPKTYQVYLSLKKTIQVKAENPVV